jgi:branched-chain amino acid transport system substrate-binding protein
MSKKSLTILLIVLVIVILGLILYVVDLKQQHIQAVSNEPIKIGFIGALTGDAAYYGESDKNGMALAVEEINSQGGINGQPIEVIYEDGQCNGKEATKAAQKLINVDQVDFIFGGTCSGETLAISPITEAAQMILFSSFSSSPDITQAGDYVFRNSVSDLDTGIATAILVNKNGVEKVSILAESTDYAQGFANVFESEFKKLGGKILSNESFMPGTTDFRAMITKAKSLNPDAIIISPQGESGALMLKQIKAANYTGGIYSNLILGDEKIIKLAEGAAEGLYYCDTAGLSKENPKANHFIDTYQEKFGEIPSLDFYSGARYDSVFIIAQAIEEVGNDTNKIKDYLYDLDNYDGVLGNVKFDQNGDILGAEFADFQIQNSQIVNLEN